MDHITEAEQSEIMSTLERKLRKSQDDAWLSGVYVRWLILAWIGSTLIGVALLFAVLQARQELEMLRDVAPVECVCTLDACHCEAGR